jgi:hypothetical protein
MSLRGPLRNSLTYGRFQLLHVQKIYLPHLNHEAAPDPYLKQLLIQCVPPAFYRTTVQFDLMATLPSFNSSGFAFA